MGARCFGGGRKGKTNKEGGKSYKKNAISPLNDASGKKVSVLLSASVERFGVSRMQDFVIVDRHGVGGCTMLWLPIL